MKFKSLKTLSILGLASLTLISCSSKPKSISCDGINWMGSSFKFTADQEKIIIEETYKGKTSTKTKLFADNPAVTVEGSKIIINDDDPMAEAFLGKGPYELSLKECATGLTPAYQYFLD